MSTQKAKHYSVKKGVELATAGRTFGKLIDLSTMEIGDSFTYPMVDSSRVQTLTNDYGRKNGAAFFINLTESIGTCWRIS